MAAAVQVEMGGVQGRSANRSKSRIDRFGNATSGMLGTYPIGVLTLGGLLDSSPTIYVIDAFAGANGLGTLFLVDGRTG
jgi:hypothetical protein